MSVKEIFTYLKKLPEDNYEYYQMNKGIMKQLINFKEFEVAFYVNCFKGKYVTFLCGCDIVCNCHLNLNYENRFKDYNTMLYKLFEKFNIKAKWDISNVNYKNRNNLRYIILKKDTNEDFTIYVNSEPFRKPLENNFTKVKTNDIELLDYDCYVCRCDTFDIIDEFCIKNNCCKAIACEGCFKMLLNKEKCACCRSSLLK